MANSRCPKCEGNFFEMVENKPSNSRVEILFVQCVKYGSVVGAVETVDMESKLNELISKMDDLVAAKLNISHINDNIKSVFQEIQNLKLTINQSKI